LEMLGFGDLLPEVQSSQPYFEFRNFWLKFVLIL
jgi:hypothetical protein